MAEVQDLNQTSLLMDLVVHENRRVDQLTHAGPLSNCAPHAGKPAEQIDVIEQAPAKVGSSLAVVQGDTLYDLGQIASALCVKRTR
jgi:hypothetical protein